MSKKWVWYSTSEDHEQRYSIETDLDLSAYLCDIPGLEETDATRHHSYIAQECAEYYHSDHDGWESRWPLEFKLYASEDGEAVSTHSVERETEPVFYATRVKP